MRPSVDRDHAETVVVLQRAVEKKQRCRSLNDLFRRALTRHSYWLTMKGWVQVLLPLEVVSDLGLIFRFVGRSGRWIRGASLKAFDASLAQGPFGVEAELRDFSIGSDGGGIWRQNCAQVGTTVSPIW